MRTHTPSTAIQFWTLTWPNFYSCVSARVYGTRRTVAITAAPRTSVTVTTTAILNTTGSATTIYPRVKVRAVYTLSTWEHSGLYPFLGVKQSRHQAPWWLVPCVFANVLAMQAIWTAWRTRYAWRRAPARKEETDHVEILRVAAKDANKKCKRLLRVRVDGKVV